MNGAAQLMVTLTLVLVCVVGAAGTLGTAAALMVTSDESGPRPMRFLAATLKV